jgi:type II secretory pathway component GspD/PulD (secretin)
MVARLKAEAWKSNVPAARARRSRGAAPGCTRGKRAALALVAAVGMAWGPTALTAAPPGPGLAALAAAQAPAQPQARPSRAHVALNTGIDCNRRGDYEQAAVLFQQAQEGWADLSPTEQQELTRWVQSNGAALQARREGAQQLALAEQAVASGRAAEAGEILKRVLANQYLSATDKQRAQDLARLAPPRAGAVPTPGPGVAGQAGNPAATSLARSKLQQARAMLVQGKYDAAEQLANEAHALNAVYLANEDNPPKVLEDVFRARTDPKSLLGAARAALKQGDLDRAEALAQMAAKADSSWSLHLWGDSPAQVLKDVQAARAKAGPAGVRTPSRPEGGDAAPWARPTQPEPDRPGLIGSVRGMFSTSSKPDGSPNPAPPPADAPAAKPDQGPPLSGPAPAGNTTESARRLLRQARHALQEGNLDLAAQLTAQARALAPSLSWQEDNPDILQAEIQRARAQRPVAARPAPAAPLPEEKGPQDARSLLRLGRQLYSAGDLDGAARVARKARAAATGRWGIFEDSPEKLQQEIDEARSQRDREESGRVLAQARKLYEQGEYDQASREAYRAQKLHGPYSWWDLGDRPMKLLAEIETARSKNRRPGGPSAPGGTAVAKQEPAGATYGQRGDLPRADPRAAQARQMMVEARVALQQGDVARARALVQQVEPLSGSLDRREDHLQLVALHTDLASAGQAGPGPGAPPPGPAPLVSPAAAAVPVAPLSSDPAKAQAQQLLAQCRQLQREGRLVEARQKALAAQATRAVFTPSEDSPELALIQLSALSYKQIDNLMQQAADYQQTAAGNPANYQRAEQNLRQARQLAAGFGFDTAPVDARLQALVPPKAVAAGAVPPRPGTGLPGEVRVAGGQGPEGAGPGPVLLGQARQELRKGNTPEARKLAEEVYNGPYGLRDQAESLLRSIDAEEFAQQKLAADRTYEAGMSALRRRDLPNAANILRTVNPKLLDDEKQARLKNLFALPEMQPNQVAQTAGQERPPSPGEGVAHVSDRGPAAGSPGDQDLLKITQAMQDVKFQQLRQEGLRVQQEAAERFRTGDTERAVEVLQEYAANLSTVQLDSDRVALLRRPIESRLLTFKTLRAQRAFEDEHLKGRRAVVEGLSRTEAAERNKKEKVAKLMQQYDAFYKEGKYQEAEMYAMAAFELDPDDAAAGAAVKIARIQRRQVDYQNLKDRKESYNLNALNEGEDPGEWVDPKVGVKYDVEHTKAILKSRDGADKAIMQTKSDKDKELDQLLTKPVNLSFNDAPLDEVLEDLRAWHGVNIVPDMPALDSEGITLKRPVTIKLENVQLRSALNLLLHQIHLTYVPQDGVLLITTEGNARGKMVTATYQVADLIMPIDNSPVPAAYNLTAALERSAHPQTGLASPGTVSPVLAPTSMSTGSQASAPVAGPGMPGQPGTTGGGSPGVKGATPTMENELIKLITSTVSPQTWDSMGGQGSINYYPLGMALVINQTPDIQEQIADLLAALRRLQDQEVAVEMRFISVAESFFERIGLDFQINVTNNHTNASFGPLLTSGNFQPAGFINTFNPQHFVSGLTPAGTLTSDLSIPLRTSSFGMAVPPFGAFPNIPGADGGISLGLAFLSDIQVFMFLEAAQGDERTNVLQAPKLTLTNGQTSAIAITDQQFFITNVAIIQQGGQLAFVPTNTPFPIGVTMILNAIITADRRFVRMSFSGVTLSNLASADVPLFPIVTPIIPLFEGGFPANPVLFTQFLQQPVLNSINITTTATVPDGGTVVLGGLKRLSEGRNEFGPPVLSKIPWINRLFRNQAYGKEVESLLIMVTPRIIINEEEERIQTGVVTRPPPQ